MNAISVLSEFYINEQIDEISSFGFNSLLKLVLQNNFFSFKNNSIYN